MPRRQFKTDVANLCLLVSNGALPNVWAVNCDGLDDNDEFVVTMRPRKRGEQQTDVRILCGDVDMYPNTNSYFLSIDQPHATASDAAFLATFQSTKHCQGSSRERTVSCLVRDMSELFASFSNPPGLDRRSGNTSPVYAIPEVDGGVTDNSYGDRVNSTTYDSDNDMESEAEDDWDDATSAFDFNCSPNIEIWPHKIRHIQQKQSAGDLPQLGWPRPLPQRISRDLQAVVHQGYRFGILQGMTDTAQDHLLSVAIRVSALGLPRQTLLAWDLEPTVYVALLIRIEEHYAPYEDLVAHPSRMAKVSFRIGKCQRYKPSLFAAKEAFGLIPTTMTAPQMATSSTDPGTFSKIMISNSLNPFMSNNFLRLSKFRDHHKCSWTDALDAMRRQTLDHMAAPESTGKDGLDNGRSTEAINTEHSFPLLAMQFAMDQVVNCTKYCQACHARMNSATESIKPTVCSDDLCLFQYIQMGMGRSTEHEILAQPTVVDLLVSFCYAALCPVVGSTKGAIRTHPENIGLQAVDLSQPCQNQGIYRCQSGRRPHVLLRERCLLSQFRVGDWVAIWPSTTIPSDQTVDNYLRHAVVTQVDIENSTLYLSHGTYPYLDAEIERACVYRHDTPFEDINDKLCALRLILDTLPPIAWIRMHLERHACTSLRAVPGVSPSAARLLEWILATNRSCILEIQCVELDFGSNPQNSSQWAQFSFLHGSPDADTRFLAERKRAAVSRRHPTLLAWHGSAISNWHSIVRSGLDYSTVANGRSYGNGVYFSSSFDTSRGYACATAGKQWGNSQFDLQAALSLNEVVNAPGQFRCVNPHYVVPQRDWHQCRILLVGNRKEGLATPCTIDKDGELTTEIAASPAPAPLAASGWFVQDKKHIAYGPYGTELRVPIDLFPAIADRQSGTGQENSQSAGDGGDVKENEARADMDAEDLAFCVLSDGATQAAQESQPGPVILASGTKATAAPAPLSLSAWSSSTAAASRALRKAQSRDKQARRAPGRLGKDDGVVG